MATYRNIFVSEKGIAINPTGALNGSILLVKANLSLLKGEASRLLLAKEYALNFTHLL